MTLVTIVSSTDGDHKPAGQTPAPAERIQRWLYQGRRHEPRLLRQHRTAATLIGVAVVGLLLILTVALYPLTRDRAVVLPESPAPAVTLTSTIGPSIEPTDQATPSSIPAAPPPPPTQPEVTATPAPVPTTKRPPPPPARIIIPVTFFEAESAANTLGGTARTHSEPNASGGLTIGNLGRGGANFLRFNGLTVPASGTFTLTIFYISGENDRLAFVSVNGTGSTLTFPATGDWETIGSVTTRINLRGGANTVTFSNAAGPAPDLDRIRLGP